MPTVEASEQFEINASLDKCWNFFSELSNIGSCIPGCESVIRIDDTTAELRVKLKVGYLAKTFQMKARFKEVLPPGHIAFVGNAPDAEVSGDLDINHTEIGSRTAVKYSIEIRPISVVGRTAVSMMGKDLVKKQVSEFVLCVKAKLEV